MSTPANTEVDPPVPDSVWMLERDTAIYPALGETQSVDTVVIGGGITGVTTAWLLARAGQQVTLLESDRIGASNTGNSTGNLYGTLSSGLAKVRDKWGDEVLREIVAMRMQAVDRIEQIASELDIDCGFTRGPLHIGIAGNEPQALQSLKQEFEAAEAGGLAPRWIDAIAELPVEYLRVFRIDGQAQFNPYRYTRAMAAALATMGVKVHEHSAVLEVDAGKGEARTADGTVRARHIVFATHTPKGFNLVQAEMEVRREYGVAAPLKNGAPPEGTFWVRDRSRSWRSWRHDGRDYLVLVGEKHKTGENRKGVDYHQRLRDDARARFELGRFQHAWSAQQYHAADELPYIGPSAHDNVHIATGFGADGLTWGTVAAGIIADEIRGSRGRPGELLSPRRFTPAKSAKIWASENVTVTRHLVGDRLRGAELKALEQVGAGEGRIVEVEGHKHAVYRSPEGELTVLSPVCPHLKCHVAWNPAETSWDCPCHGSRFGPDGHVIEGPALRPLEVRTLD